jgi:hypothetical protein
VWTDIVSVPMLDTALCFRGAIWGPVLAIAWSVGAMSRLPHEGWQSS